MKLSSQEAEIFIPDQKGADEAIGRTTHMAIGAHPDDLEIMAPNLILDCYGRADRWFCGVVTTNGAGSPRSLIYADYSDEEMARVRRGEQKKAAVVGEYGALVMLNYTSAQVKDPAAADTKDDLKNLIAAAKPTVLGTHNLADKHATHVATAVRTIQALRELPNDALPEKVYGFEVWRGLDWMLDEEAVTFDVSVRDNVSAALVSLYDSQISGGKRYDLATMGRRRERATYLASHGTDESALLALAMDLTPLVRDPALDMAAYVTGTIERFRESVAKNIRAAQ
ncbi:MAG: PIG-L family deacetylase [Kiritimatiellae bacterium]|nr:PIG-L family deacetylase [Kiritimatiellia bacterium]